ncbi:MAG: P1 family peptidase, partial [Alphaproteobacteria bacterium]|nr:P1 family peptidase [Alphaproteobacteria bacterium]
PQNMDFLPNGVMDPLFQMTMQATEEAILDAMIANKDMIGLNGRKAVALPHDRLMEIIHAAKAI